MKFTIDRALQKGIEAQKVGKAQEADRYYTAILKANPKHPDANHNLGVLAVSVNKMDAALPFFKAALDANPDVEQFWVSYIDALINGGYVTIATQALRSARSKLVREEKLAFLEAKLALKT
mgnify:CR=1 FL=1